MPTIIIPDKICPHCGGNKWSTWIRKDGVTIYNCIVRKAARFVRYESKRNIIRNRTCILPLFPNQTKKNRKAAAKRVEYSIHKQRILDGKKRRYEGNKEQIRKNKRKWEEANRKELRNSYIKSLLTANSRISFKNIPIELIEIKRKQIKLYRHVKQKENNGNIGYSGR